MPRTEQRTEARDELLTRDEVIERLRVTSRWMQRADAEGRFSIVKVGRLNRYLESEIEAYIAEQTRPARVSA